VAGCHANQDDANKQMAALYRNADGEEATVTTTEELGGKPSKGTSKDRRLKENQQAADAVAPDERGNCPEGHRKTPDGMCVPDATSVADQLLEATGADSVEVDDDVITLNFDGETVVDEAPVNNRWIGPLAV